MQKIIKLTFRTLYFLTISNSLFTMEYNPISELSDQPEPTSEIFLYTINHKLNEKFNTIILKHTNKTGFDILKILEKWNDCKLPPNNESYQYTSSIFTTTMFESQDRRLKSKIQTIWSTLMINFINNNINSEDDLNKILGYAVQYGHSNIVQLALKKGADIDSIPDWLSSFV